MELIRSARLRGVIKEEAQPQEAIYAFRDKYYCLPGDGATASQFFTGAFNGNGDGLICGSQNDANSSCGFNLNETMAVAQHLLAAGMLAWPLSTPMDISIRSNGGNEVSPGRNIFGSPSWNGMGWGVQSLGTSTGNTNITFYCAAAFSTSANEIFFTTDSQFMVGNPIMVGAITGADAYAIDSKIDDGLPYTGRVMAGGNSGWETTIPISQVTCPNANMASGTYNNDAILKGPVLVFRADIEY
jgi:hypothetical protein